MLAYHVEDTVVPVCLSGAGVTIPQKALPYFRGKRVRIFPHEDQPGQAAAERWREQLQDVAAVDCFSFQGLRRGNGEHVKDLNDLLKIGRESYRGNRNRINNVMRFSFHSSR